MSWLTVNVMIIWGVVMVVGTVAAILITRRVLKARREATPEQKIRRLAKKRHIDLEKASKPQVRALVRDALGCTEVEARELVNAVMRH